MNRKKPQGKHNYHARKKTYALYLLWRTNRTHTGYICFLLEHFPTEWKDNHSIEIVTTDDFVFNGVPVRLYYEERQTKLRNIPEYKTMLHEEMYDRTERIKRYQQESY